MLEKSSTPVHHRLVEKQGLQRPLSDPQCFGGALSFASWSLSKGAKPWEWENGDFWYKKDETQFYKFGAELAKNFKTVLRSVFVPSRF